MTQLCFSIIVLAFLRYTATSRVLAGGGCKEMDFKVTFEGKTLANHVLKTVRARDDGHCESQCFMEDRCISYSFGTSASGKKNMCELSDSDHFMHPEDVVVRENVIYRSAKNTCTCKGNQTCHYDFIAKTGRCVCPSGFTGQNCEININDCTSSSCFHGATCVDEVNAYRCLCVPGSTGMKCEIDIDECQSNPCLNGATCTDKFNDYYCVCTAGYTGKTCNTEINECDSSPCRNDGTCHDRLNSFECTCTAKYYGTTCQHYDHCVAYPCRNGGSCTDRTTHQGRCTCTNLYYGNNCEYYKHCDADQNLCKGESTCYNTSNTKGYRCKCPGSKWYNYSKERCQSSDDDDK